MGYAEFSERLDRGEVVILDGGTGTELERRGVSMNHDAWCGAATLDHLETLEAVHLDYINAGADIITANTYASSRLMLGPAGLGDQVQEINRAAIRTAQKARMASDRSDVLIAGSLSHMIPVIQGSDKSDVSKTPDLASVIEASQELATLHVEEGCDLILLEMLYHPERMAPLLQAAIDTGLPVWAGFSVRSGKDGRVLSFAADQDIPFEEAVQVLDDFNVSAAGVMHSPSNIVSTSIAISQDAFDGPLMAYPDSGYFKMPHWQFDDIIRPDEFRLFATDWVAEGVQIIGGCCGLSPHHIEAVASLKGRGGQLEQQNGRIALAS